MILYLTETEQNQITFREVIKRNLSEEYLRTREDVWQNRVRFAQENGKQLWNGEIYTIETILQYDESQIIFELGTCEYKDVVLRCHLGTKGVESQFGSSHILNFITLDCIPVTQDGKAVFGVRARGTNVKEGALGLIGGSLNKDGMTVGKLDDITSFMIKEIQEETAIQASSEMLKLYSINFFRSKYEFLYTFPLNVHSTEISTLHKEGEFSNLVALGIDELKNDSHEHLDTVRFCHGYLSDLLSQQ